MLVYELRLVLFKMLYSGWGQSEQPSVPSLLRHLIRCSLL